MRATIKNYIQAEQERREESGEKGFSLIELIIVVVILGILAAIAIPVFMGIQGQARDSAVESATANAASQLAATAAQSPSGAVPDATTLSKLTAGGKITFAVAGTSIDTICVSGSGNTSKYTVAAPFKAGPGC